VPTNLANLESVSKAHGTAALLTDVSLGVSTEDRVGVVGTNGSGKTTLVSVLAGTSPPDAGRVTHANGLRISVLRQDVALPPAASVREVVVGDTAEHEWAGDAGIRGVLDGLGLHALGLDAVVGPMSGGERRRVALAALLVQDSDLLVLDEPTNHLDVEGVAWLAAHLGRRGGGLVVVTHDRWFLDQVCTTTWEVAEGRVHAYQGGYSAYVLARAERDRQSAAGEARRRNAVRKELAWLRRGPPARTSKPQFRIDAANALIADEPPARDPVALQSFASGRLGKRVYDVEEVTLRLGGKVLLDDVTWRLGPGDRISVVGVNGSGKTSLLRLLLAELAPSAGRVERGLTVRPAYLPQEVAPIGGSVRVLEAVEAVARSVDVGGGRTMTASQLLERFGFGSDRQWTPVDDLSGGERRRLQLLRLLMAEPNVLLLDEPTNDLDIDTLTALEDLLDSWPGTLVVVSHDRYFIERTTDRTVALVGDGRLAELPGGVEQYLERRRTAVTAAGTTSGSTRQRAGDTRAARKELGRLEREIARLDRRERVLHEQLAEQAADHVEMVRLGAELRDLHAERERSEEAWLVLSEQT